MKYPECYSCGKWAPRLSVVCNALAAVFKLAVGIMAGSKGLVADSLHSAADAMAALFNLIAMKIASKPKDLGHPYGHGKVEYISTLFAGLLLFAGATGIFLDALHSFSSGNHRTPHAAALLATVASLIFSYVMYSSNKCAGIQLGSPALIADANESRADSISCLAVLAGIIGSKMGFEYADTAAAVVVSIFIYHISIEMFIEASHGLIDLSVDGELLDNIVDKCMAVEGVRGIEDIKTRRMGRTSHANIAIDVEKNETVFKGHSIAEEVKRIIRESFREIDEVTVMIHPVKRRRFEL